MRHRVGQLNSVKGIPFAELEAMRLETAEKLKVLADAYWSKREAEGTWKPKKKYGEEADSFGGTYGANSTLAASAKDDLDENTLRKRSKKRGSDNASAPGTGGLARSSKAEPRTPGILKNAPAGGDGSLAAPKFDYRNIKG